MGSTGLEHNFVNTCEQSTNSENKKSDVLKTVHISAKAQKIELIKQNLDQLSDAQIDAIIKMVFQVRND